MNIFTALDSIKKWGFHKPVNGKQIGLIAIGALAGLIVQIILLNLPIVTVSTETREPYYVTETSYQPYASNEYPITEQSVQKNIVIADGYSKVVPSGVIVPFQIDRPGSRLTGTFENTIPGSFVIYNSSNRIIWEKLGNRGNLDLNLPPGSYKAKFQENLMWGEDVYIYLAIEWDEVAQGTTSQEISGYREMPVIVSKERVVLKDVKYSIWQLITGLRG
jgi:hypothetical protein